MLSIKSLLFLVIPVILILLINTTPVNHQRFLVTPEGRIGFLQYLPPGYYENSDKYPLVIFLHGIVERGVDSRDPDVLWSSVDWVDNLGPPAWVRKGTEFPFILISPQLKSNHDFWPEEYILEVIKWARENHRVDEKGIHITGLSLGGGAVFATVQNNPEIFASAVPVCAFWNAPAKAADIASENVAVWAFHGDDDPQVPLHTVSFMIDSINNCSPPPSPRARLTAYSGVTHSVWNMAYTPDETYHTPDIYSWMSNLVKKKRGGNFLPSANAGTDKHARVYDTVLLSGSGTDVDGEIMRYAWAQLSGPPVLIARSDQNKLAVKLPRRGTYYFRLTVTDDAGDSDTDFVRVIADK